MFKQPHPIRQRIMERFELKIKDAEVEYDERHNNLIGRHAQEIQAMYKRHDAQHEELIEDVVGKIVQ